MMFPLQELTEIKVLVIPVGRFDKEKFNAYFNLISTFKEINLEDLTFVSPSGLSLFKNQKILKGKVRIKFLKSYSRELVNLEEFQIYRQYLGIIGVIHCSSFPDLSQGYGRFLQLLSKFPKTMNIRCFAFEPEDNQPDDEKNVIMIPHQSDEQLSFYVGTMIADFVSSILQSLSGLVDSIEKKSIIQSPLQFDSGTSGEDMARVKKRTHGRSAKLCADLYLLCGNLEEAINCYANSIEYSRSNLDDIWVASSLEGFLAASFIQTEQLDPSIISKDYYLSCMEKIKEILHIYDNANVSLLAADTCIKLCQMASSLKLRGDAVQYLSKAWSYSEFLSADEKIYVCNHLCRICKDLGYDRKFAFFTRILAQLTVKTVNPFLALSCYKRILPFYKLDKTFKRDGLNKQVAIGWPLIQKVIMKEVMDISLFTKDLEVITFFTTHFLRQLHHYIGASEQQEMMEQLRKLNMQPLKEKTMFNLSSIIDNVNSSFTGLPVVRKVEILPLLNSSFTLKQQKAGHDPFLYNPFSKGQTNKSKSDIFMIQYETSNFTVYLDNPMAFPVVIQSMSLSVQGTLFEATKSALSVPPYAKSFPVTLSGRPLGSGEIVIVGVKIKVLNYEKEHAIDSEGNGPEFFKPVKKTETQSIGMKVKVVDAQPFLKVQKTSLHNDSIMLIEGEICTVHVSLENIGSRSIDFLTVQFREKSTAGKSEFGLNDYEIEYYAEQVKVFTYNEDDIKKRIPIETSKGAGTHTKIGSFDFVFTITGKLGCSGGTLIFDYGCNGSSEPTAVYSRSTKYDFLVTVVRGLECTNIDILPFQRDNFHAFLTLPSMSLKSAGSVEELIVSSPVSKQSPNQSIFSPTTIESFINKSDVHGGPVTAPEGTGHGLINSTGFDKNYFLLTLDLKNNWHNSMNVIFNVSESGSNNPNASTEKTMTQTTIMSKSTKRVVVPMKRVSLSEEDLLKPYPPLGNRQYVVPKGPKLTKAEQDFKKRVFWYKNYLLNLIDISWESTLSRKGSFVLYDMRISKSMINVLKTDGLLVEVSIDNNNEIFSSSISAKLWEHVSIKFSVLNQHDHCIKPMIRVFPVDEINHRFEASQWDSKVIFGGSNQFVMENMNAGEQKSHEFSLLFLACGKYRLLYSCEDLLSGHVSYCTEPIVLDIIV